MLYHLKFKKKNKNITIQLCITSYNFYINTMVDRKIKEI